MKQGPSSPKSAGARGLTECHSPDSARLPFLSKRAQSHKAALEQQAAEAAERLATKSPPTKEKKANQVKKRPAMGKKLAKRPAAAMAGQRLETRPALKRPASQSTSAVEQKKQEQGPEIRPGFSGWLRKIYQTGVYPRVVHRRTLCCHRCPPSTLWNTGHDKSKASGAEKWHACPAHKLRLEIKPATKQISEALPRPCQDLAEEGK